MALGLLALGLALGMYISYFLCRFHLRLVVNTKPVYPAEYGLNSNFSIGRLSFSHAAGGGGGEEALNLNV